MSDIVNSFCLRRKNILFVKNEVFYLPFCLHILKYPYKVGLFSAFWGFYSLEIAQIGPFIGLYISEQLVVKWGISIGINSKKWITLAKYNSLKNE